MVDVAVIGSGISGLATAWSLMRQGLDVVVLERQANSGGNAVTERIGGFLMEHGPSTIDARATAATAMGHELGLDGQRCQLGSGVRNRYLVGDGRLQPIATHPLGFLMSGYLSVRARLRMLAELAIPRGKGGAEESISAFCSRRFGPEFTARVMEPLVRGVYGGDAGSLSVQAIFPALVEMEQRCGSISAGILASRLSNRKMPGRRLYSWRGGIGALPHLLARQLGGRVHTGIAVRRILRVPGGFVVDSGLGGRISARAVVIATQPHVAAQLLDELDNDAAAAAGAIGAPPIAVVYLGYRRAQVDHPLDGLGFFAPQGEGSSLNGVQFCSTMFEGRAPADHISLAAYFGGDGAPDLARAPSDVLVALARDEFADLLGAKGEPVVARTRHWPRGLPQYRLGHADRIAALCGAEDRLPGLFLTGNYFNGPSVGACLSQATITADHVRVALAREGKPGLLQQAGADALV
jgi:oxygen-dependent protoporphyrinogen oxidase